MTDRLPREALIHDLAIVLAGSLHPGAQIGPAPRLAAHRLRDVLGIEGGTPVRVIEPLIAAALTDATDRIDALEERVKTLEGGTPQARQLQMEADLAIADLAASGCDRHGRDCGCSYCYVPEEES
jgi:hypothetical protein